MTVDKALDPGHVGIHYGDELFVKLDPFGDETHAHVFGKMGQGTQ